MLANAHKLLRAYPSRPASQYVIQVQARWSKPTYFSTFLSRAGARCCESGSSNCALVPPRERRALLADVPLDRLRFAHSWVEEGRESHIPSLAPVPRHHHSLSLSTAAAAALRIGDAAIAGNTFQRRSPHPAHQCDWLLQLPDRWAPHCQIANTLRFTPRLARVLWVRPRLFLPKRSESLRAASMACHAHFIPVRSSELSRPCAHTI